MSDDKKRELNIESWFAKLIADVEGKGFTEMWRNHIADLVSDVRAGRRGIRLNREHLFKLLMRDKAFSTHYEGLPREVHAEVEAELRTKGGEAEKVAPAITRTVAQLRPVDFPGIREADGSLMKCLKDEVFLNWGRTVKNTPVMTCLPKTKLGVCNIVKWATANKKRVRVSGYRHTWGDFYSNDGEVLISLLPLDVVNNLPASEPPIDPMNEMQGITITGHVQEGDVTKALCRIGAATTNEQFRRWCLSESGGNWNWTVPLNVIMVEITWGGSNGPICHGAGWRNKTLSDLVAEVEFVNAKGEIQVVNDPEQLKTAAGCFGLLGVITAITLRLDPMTYAVLQPVKQRVGLAVPPPDGYQVPAKVDMSGVTLADLKKATADFIYRCENDYYSEWFWFTLQPECWINTWKNNGDRKDARDYPSKLDTWVQELEEYVAGLLADSRLFNIMPEWLQATTLGASAMLTFPANERIVTPLIDGLHFRRGIQNMRVRDMEMQIPIPPRRDDPTKPDWSVCQRAWWDAIARVYSLNESSSKVPMRLTLEMRIMADSAITLAPQRGNTFGTCSIEVLTTINTDRAEWQAFMQDISDVWTSYVDPSGKPLNVRPHWAKMWQGLTMSGRPVVKHLREVAYKDSLPEFQAGLAAVAKAGGFSVTDMRTLFSNSLLDDVIWGEST